MTISRKAVISLLIAVLLFGGFSVLAFNGLFDLPEARFYNPSVTEEVFPLPTTMMIILFLAFFLTTYLIIFLLFNLRQDPLIVVQNRLKQLQISLIEQFYERKGEADWARWILELEHRRDEIRALLKRGIRADSGSNSGDMDILINKSWDELLAMLGSRRNLAIPSNLSVQEETSIAEEKIASILNKLLETRTDASVKSSMAAGNRNIGLLKKASEKAMALSASIAAPIAGAIGDGIVNSESAERIEVLDELDDAERHEDLNVATSDVDILASQIEFNADIEPETKDNELFDGELEIASPFSTMVFGSLPIDNSEAAEDNPSKESRDNNDDDGLNTDVTKGLPLITSPFSGILGSAEIESLETIITGEDRHTYDNDNSIIIKEREGIHYISEDVLVPPPEFAATLNQGFKDLVDEVTK